MKYNTGKLFWNCARGLVVRRLSMSASGAYKTTSPISKPASATWTASITHKDLQTLIIGRKAGGDGYGWSGMAPVWEYETDGPDDQGLYLVNLARTLTGRTIIALKVQAELDVNHKLQGEKPAQITEILWETNEEIVNMENKTAREVKDWAKFVCEASIGVSIQDDSSN